MSNYNISTANPNYPPSSGLYLDRSSKSGPSSSGRCDSGISDVFLSGPMDVERDGGFRDGFVRPKFVLQGSLDDVENGDSGIMMGEDETFTDSARGSHRNPQTMDVDAVSSPVPTTRSRSSSPKSMSDEDTPKPAVQERSGNAKRKAPRLPKRIVPSRSMDGDRAATVNPKMNSRSSSANALISTSSVNASSSGMSAKPTPQRRSQSPTLHVSSVATSDPFTCSVYGMPASYSGQRVPPVASDFSTSMQNLSRYMDLFIPDKEGDTGFHLAVIHGRLDVLDGLLYIASRDRSLLPAINEQNGLYQTPLHLAAHTQQLDVMRKLLIAGAAIDLTDHKGNTALHIASRFSSTRVLEEIARYIPLQTILEAAQIRNNEGYSCVHVAAKNGNTDVLAKLKSLGVDINMQDLNSGKTALHMVAERSSLTDVQCLIETCEADVNRVTYSGCSALHIAAGRGDIAIVAYLISMGANPDLVTDEGDQALDLSSSEQVLSFLTRVSSLKWLY